MRKYMDRFSFDHQVFLSTVGAARTITQCTKDYKIFSQGDPAENVFYIQQGRVKIKVKSKQGKEAVIAILGAGEFLGDRLSACRWLRRWYLANLALYFEL